MNNYKKHNNNAGHNNGAKFTTYGDILKNKREQYGLSTRQVARDLHVREDILIALEEGNFSKIPPQGYSRNMIKSYSRMLGLNSAQITNMFLDSEYTYRIGKKRDSIQQITDENRRRVPTSSFSTNSSFKTPRQQIEDKKNNPQNSSLVNESYMGTKKNSPFGPRIDRSEKQRYQNSPRARRELAKQESIEKGGKILRDSSFLLDDIADQKNFSSAHKRLEARKKATMTSTSGYRQASPYSKKGSPSNRRALKQRNLITRDEAHNFKNNDANNFTFMNVYNNNNKQIPKQQKVPLPIVIVIVAVLLIILFAVLFFMGKQQENSKTDVSNINVTGLTDPEKTSNSNDNVDTSSVNNSNSAAPASFDFVYKVKNGQTCYMEIYENNSSKPSLAREVKSGETDTFKVTDSLKVITTRPEAVEFSFNGQIVQPSDPNKTGVYTYIADYQQCLSEWKTKHYTSNTNGSSAGANNNLQSNTDSSSSKPKNTN